MSLRTLDRRGAGKRSPLELERKCISNVDFRIVCLFLYLQLLIHAQVRVAFAVLARGKEEETEEKGEEGSNQERAVGRRLLYSVWMATFLISPTISSNSSLCSAALSLSCTRMTEVGRFVAPAMPSSSLDGTYT